ncbi:MAG: molybdopterin-guanine dinucleotide biosynthesis protein B [Campylobacteraceae bacterium]|jgi:molybdopterin-guanine dinucleotide biosynthesis protein B|nr:molybdopterin-guanine dinucleotide biosynthesis protein B [Campylobacteraceae bacterium]
MKSLAVAFTGPSNSGKTTLIVKLSTLLKDRYKIAIIKHDPKDKAVFDIENKDSYKFSQTGANVAVTSPKRTTYFFHDNQTLKSIISTLLPFDILFVEGLKELELPRVAIFRDEIDESYLPYCKAIAIDESINLKNYNMPENIAVLDLNNEKMVADWVLKNAKEIR